MIAGGHPRCAADTDADQTSQKKNSLCGVLGGGDIGGTRNICKAKQERRKQDSATRVETWVGYDEALVIFLAVPMLVLFT